MASKPIDHDTLVESKIKESTKIGNDDQFDVPTTTSFSTVLNRNTSSGEGVASQGTVISINRPNSGSSNAILPAVHNVEKTENLGRESVHGNILPSVTVNSTTEVNPKQSTDEKVKPTVNVKENGILSGVNGVVNQVVENFKKMLGFGPECLNGGTKNSAGECLCPAFFHGKQCEHMTCTNGGTPMLLKKKARRTSNWECKCPNPEFIYGKHCELIKCMNGGQPIANTGKCACNDYWYGGDFCENYTSSWITLVGIPLVAIIVVLLCCIVCRLDFCPRRSTREANRRRRNHTQGTTAGRPHERRGHERQQQQLLNAPRSQRQMVPYRLETIPVFNPRLLDDELPKIMDAPPSYEQALTMSTPTISHPNQQPPNYSPRSGTTHSGILPPPPSCRPPAVPHS